MNLIQKQKVFSVLSAKLILKAVELGYEVTFGEAWRPPETAKDYARQGKGISNSNHCQRLAIDLNLFKDGQYLSRTEAYTELGEIWEGWTSPEYKCAWGGRFRDGNHFSLEHNGVK